MNLKEPLICGYPPMSNVVYREGVVYYEGYHLSGNPPQQYKDVGKKIYISGEPLICGYPPMFPDLNRESYHLPSNPP